MKKGILRDYDLKANLEDSAKRTTANNASRNWIFSKRPLDTHQRSSIGIKKGDRGDWRTLNL